MAQRFWRGRLFVCLFDGAFCLVAGGLLFQASTVWSFVGVGVFLFLRTSEVIRSVELIRRGLDLYHLEGVRPSYCIALSGLASGFSEGRAEGTNEGK